MLQHRAVKQLIVTGVTTEVFVNTTVREANDRGYECLLLEDCADSYFPGFHKIGVKMIKEQGGVFGWGRGCRRTLQGPGSVNRFPVEKDKERSDVKSGGNGEAYRTLR